MYSPLKALTVAWRLGRRLRPKRRNSKFDVTGQVCMLSAGSCASGPFPLTVSFDLNTSGAQLSPTFFQAGGISYLLALDGQSLAITDFSTDVNGRMLSLPAASSASLQMILEGDSAFGPYEFFLTFPKNLFLPLHPGVAAFTEAQ
jgi:hypothetical protein